MRVSSFTSGEEEERRSRKETEAWDSFSWSRSSRESNRLAIGLSLSQSSVCVFVVLLSAFFSFLFLFNLERNAEQGRKKGLDDVKMTRFSCLPPREFGSSAEEGWSNRRIATSFSIFRACLMTGRRADSSYYTAIPPCLRIRECLVWYTLISLSLLIPQTSSQFPFFYFPGVVVVVLLFYDGWLLPLSFSKLAKTSESRCCHSVSQTVRNSWSRAVTVDFSVGPSEPAASAHPCKANYPIYFRSLIHSIYIPPLPSSVPSWPSNVFRLVRFSSSADFSCAAVVCLCDSQSWRHPRPVPATTTTYLSPSRPSTVAHHWKTEETFAAFSLAGAAEVIFGSVRIRTEGKQQQQQNKKSAAPTKRSDAKRNKYTRHTDPIAIAFVMKRSAERMTNGRTRQSGPRELAKEERRWVSQEKINNSSVFSPPTRRFLLLFEFKPTAGARFRCVVIFVGRLLYWKPWPGRRETSKGEEKKNLTRSM